MQEAYNRSGIQNSCWCKAKRGGFRFYRPDDLAVEVIKGLMASVPQLEANRVDDVIEEMQCQKRNKACSLAVLSARALQV